MPFKSKAQQRWMFANHPKMAKEWAQETDFKHLPEKKKKKAEGGSFRPKNCMSCGGSMQAGGTYNSQAELEAANALARNITARKNTFAVNPENTYVARNVGDPVAPFVGADGQPYQAPQIKRSLYVPQEVGLNDITNDGRGNYFYADPQSGDARFVDSAVLSLPRFNNQQPVIASRQLGGFAANIDYERDQPLLPQVPRAQSQAPVDPLQDAIRKGIIDVPAEWKNVTNTTAGTPTPAAKRNPAWDPYFALRGLKSGAAWLGNMLENRRQNNYMYDQFATMGQLDAIPASNFQPTQNNMYAQRGGQLTRGLAPQPSFRNMVRTSDPSFDTASYMTDFNAGVRMGSQGFDQRYNLPAFRLMLENSMKGDTANTHKWLGLSQQYGTMLEDLNNVLPDAQVQQELQMPLTAPSDMLRPKKKKGGGFKINPEHKGDCTPITKSTCTGKKKQFALTMKKHHGFHKK